MTGALLLTLVLSAPVASQPVTIDAYLERYFKTFPSRASFAGRHEFDHQLEDLSAERRAGWVEFNKTAVASFREQLAKQEPGSDTALDLEAVLRHAERQVFSWETLQQPERNPLFWTGLIASSTVFLIVRDDAPEEERLRGAASRARLLPRLAKQAQEALGGTDPTTITKELCEIAARQVRGSAQFYAEGFGRAASPELAELNGELAGAGKKASPALNEFADFLEKLAEKASGSPRLGEHYAESFRLGTGLEESVDDVLARAEAALAEKRAEVADYGRFAWMRLFPYDDAPEDDKELIRKLFERIGQDHADSTEEFVEDYRQLVAESVDFVRRKDVITLPDPLTVWIDRSPSFFVGQSVGGVYPAGPYAPDADTLLYLPTPPDHFSDEMRAAFFRDFNDHFNKMITPHEIVPGHYLQAKLAAHHPRKVRALFSDGVYVEGWGTFCERLILDLGWGGPMERLAHLKKQLENIARTIVDIRVHTRGMTQEEMVTFVQEDAFQDALFADNMWRRAITTSPQLTTYFLGYTEIWSLFEDVKAARGESFVLREFNDGLMELGPVAVRHYRARMLAP